MSVSAPMADGGVVVAEQVRLPDGSRAECPAAPLLAGSLQREEVPVGSAVLAAPPPGQEATAQALWLPLPADNGNGAPAERTAPAEAPSPTAALALATADAAALPTARSTLTAWAMAVRPRTVLLAAPRSFCAGVERAIEVVERALARRPPDSGPVYVRKQIVHNKHVVRRLEERGAVFVDELDQVPRGAMVVFSAHGVSPQVRQEAEARGLKVIDATCPLVTKVHHEALRFARRGDTVVLIGHAGHEEIEGTLGEAPERTVLVETPQDVADLEVEDPERVSYLTQTTLAMEETTQIIAALKKRFPSLRGPGSEDICYATTNRQHALEAIARQVDVVLVVGSGNSSNSMRLVELAGRAGVPAHLIDGVGDIEPHWIADAHRIGLTAGASAPPALVDEVVAALGGLGPVQVHEHRTAVEDVYFAPPKEVRA
ncbi:4-hydroxy-3-methylbut-2-enyl diphosphate reductase [Streptomyces sp. CA-250714]|uniref:4-hydroxy-3-methylbut-2-enyl diphosphate reductase n=1 Tax=Streptomyces sp. CA-250714 TaxID=3240060 RepID=UPI003D8DF407